MSKPKWTGITFDENDVGSCSKCGNKEGFSMVMHMDGTKEYTTVYKCNKCGQEITMTCKRTGMNKKLWED